MSYSRHCFSYNKKLQYLNIYTLNFHKSGNYARGRYAQRNVQFAMQATADDTSLHLKYQYTITPPIKANNSIQVMLPAY